MRVVSLVVIGKGTVGGAFLRILEKQAPILKARGLELKLGIAADSSTFKDWSELSRAVAEKFEQPILIDMTAADNAAAHGDWLERGWKVVTANKKPSSAPQELYDRITAHSERYFRETTVGAGLPVIRMIVEMRESGDEVIEIRAACSGTMGFIFSACQKGSTFEAAVAGAKRLGYTEPDPRDDLRGTDIARKALILGRLIGLRRELGEIVVEDLVPVTENMDARVSKARSSRQALRYLATIGPAGIRVGLESVSVEDPFFALDGPENLFVIRTRRYDATPLMIRGPGAGAEVTAAGIFSDVLNAARSI